MGGGAIPAVRHPVYSEKRTWQANVGGKSRTFTAPLATRRRVQREAQMASSLNHRIVTVLGHR